MKESTSAYQEHEVADGYRLAAVNAPIPEEDQIFTPL